MATIGEQFKSARQARGLTVAQVAEKTRIKPTHIEAMERNEFGVFASPIYARGFIKLYAECVHLDPAPLLEAYRALAQPTPRPTLEADHGTLKPSRTPRSFAPETPLQTALKTLRDGWKRMDRRRVQLAGRALVVLLVALILFLAIRGTVRAIRTRPRRKPPVEAPRPTETGDETGFPLLEPPPDPYLDSDSFGVSEDTPP